MAACIDCEKEMGFADKMNAKSYNGLCLTTPSYPFKDYDEPKTLAKQN